VLVTPTQDEGKLIAALHEMKQGGEADLSTAIQVAQVSLNSPQANCSLTHHRPLTPNSFRSSRSSTARTRTSVSV